MSFRILYIGPTIRLIIWSMRSHKNLIKYWGRDGFSKEEQLIRSQEDQ